MKLLTFIFLSLLLIADRTHQVVNKYSRVGETVLLSCTNGSRKDDQQSWWIKKEHGNLTLLTFSTHVVTLDNRVGVYYNENERDYTLQIAHVTRNDSGIYLCAFNSFPNAEETTKFRLHVNWFDTSTFTLNVTKGETVNLTCFEDVEPPPSITWKRSENRTLPNGDTSYVGPYLNFTSSKHDRGEFFCTTETEDRIQFVKRIILDVNFAPDIYVKNTRTNATLGTELELECMVDALPAPIISWTLNGTVLDGKSEKLKIYRYRLGNYSTAAVLRIASMQSEYYGNYVCIANNSLGASENAIYIGW
jgi:hypothetical protein